VRVPTTVTVTTESKCDECGLTVKHTDIFTDEDEANSAYIGELPENWVKNCASGQCWCMPCYDKRIRKPGEVWIA